MLMHKRNICTFKKNDVCKRFNPIKFKTQINGLITAIYSFTSLITRGTELDGGVVLGECPFSVSILNE
ncbi:hypothetical protein BpHYR1_031096 [Brachionus plicatilis]|uniref:Uncharacterized protein n=1 Tax=Brachionus plicatilis TaxID=10195 RepID=A0A3M7SIJ2_BRAPC|nr:hypothetical protein BpHYR1_031096 [Brachionus plicatilis]